MEELTPERVRALAPAALFSLEGKVAVVTGAAGGIGRWLAAGLGAAGADVLLTDVDRDGLDEVRGVLERSGVTAETLSVDLTGDDAPERIVDGTLARFGRLDVLVNNAGVNRRMPILEMDRETYDFIMGIDLTLPYFLSQAAARVMIEAGGGAIVNIGSVNSAYGLEYISVYGPAKAGLSQLTRVQAVEWTQYGVRSNCISPGFMDTPLGAPIWADREISRWIFNRVLMKRPGKPAELVGLCLLLVSDAGSFITGQTVFPDGGFLAGGRWFTPDD